MPPHSSNILNKNELPKTIGEAYLELKKLNETQKITDPEFALDFVSITPYSDEEEANKIKTISLKSKNKSKNSKQKKKIKMKDQPDKVGEAVGLARSSSKERGDDCKICEEKVTEKEKGISCDVCDYWHHTKCVKMSDATYKFYIKEILQWVCPTCIKNQKEANGLYEMMIMMMKEDREKDREDREMMMTMMKRMSEQMSGLEKIIEQKIKEKIEVSEKEILIKLNEEMEERLEKFKRRKNIIIYGMPDKGGRNDKDKFEIDCQNIKKLLAELKVDVKNYEFSRIGKLSREGRSRPIRIELDKESDKYEIFKKAVNIKNTRNENFKRVIFSADMSFKQRETEKLLRDQLRERKQAGETNIKIRRGIIVKENEGVDRLN